MVDDVDWGIGAIGDSGTEGIGSIEACAIGVILSYLCYRICSIGTYVFVVALLYGRETYCVYTAIGSFETFDDIRLTAKFWLGGVRRSVQALRCRALTSGWSICGVRGEGKSGQRRSFCRQQGRQNHLAGVDKLLYVCKAAAEEQD